jgi:hypothetical protein
VLCRQCFKNKRPAEPVTATAPAELVATAPAVPAVVEQAVVEQAVQSPADLGAAAAQPSQA